MMAGGPQAAAPVRGWDQLPTRLASRPPPLAVLVFTSPHSDQDTCTVGWPFSPVASCDLNVDRAAGLSAGDPC